MNSSLLKVDISNINSMQSEILTPKDNTFHYRTSFYRWIILILIVIFYICNYFCYMLPATLQTFYQTQLNLNLTQYNWIQSIYSFPNIILPLLGGTRIQNNKISINFEYLISGLFIDSLGIRQGMIIFTAFLVLGQFIQYIGFLTETSQNTQYVWILIGRAVFGLGGECMCISINSFVSKWFEGQEISLALAITVSGAGLGMIVSGLFSSSLQEIYENIQFPIEISIYIMIFGLILILIITYIDYQAELNDKGTLTQSDLKAYNKAQKNQQDAQDIRKSRLKQSTKQSDILMYITEESFDVVKIFNDIKSFPALYWMLCLSMILMYGQLIPFQNNLEGLLEHKYNIKNNNDRGYLFTLPLVVQLFLCPIGGIVVDKIGKRAEVNIIAGILMIAQFILWGVLTCDGQHCYANFWIPLIIYGFANSIYNNFIWPGVALSIEKQYYGIAFGILDCIQQIGITVFPLIASGIFDAADGVNDPYKGYFYFCIFFAIVAILGTIQGVWIYFYDRGHANILNFIERVKGQSFFSSKLKVSFYG